MQTHLVVYISCTEAELRNYCPFERAAEFTRYPCTIEIVCSDGRSLTKECTPEGATCWGWRYFKDAWQERHGSIK